MFEFSCARNRFIKVRLGKTDSRAFEIARQGAKLQIAKCEGLTEICLENCQLKLLCEFADEHIRQVLNRQNLK